MHVFGPGPAKERAGGVDGVGGGSGAGGGLLARLDPKAMAEKAGAGGGLSGMMSNRKAKLWDEYERIYADLADKAQNDFHDFFAKAFSRAYQDQLEKLKAERKRSK